MSSKETFCLFKNVSIVKGNDYGYVYGKDISRSVNPEDNGKSSLLGSLAGYIEELKKLGVVMFVNITSSSSLLQIYLLDLLLDRLCSIFTKPFLLIQCIETLPVSNENGITFKKRLDLTEILENSLLKTWIGIFSFDPNIESCTVDISLGWDEPLLGGLPKEQNSIQINFERFMQSLYEKDASKDLTVVAGNGAEIRCHRMIFEAHSDVISAMISPHNNGIQESRNANGRIEMLENSEVGLSHLMRYLYGMKLNIDEISCDVAIELFKTAHKYKLEEILKWLGEIFLRKESDWYTPDDLLDLYFHVKNLPEFKPIEEYLLCIMLSLSKELRACERLKELKRTDPEAAFGLLSVLFDMK